MTGKTEEEQFFDGLVRACEKVVVVQVEMGDLRKKIITPAE